MVHFLEIAFVFSFMRLFILNSANRKQFCFHATLSSRKFLPALSLNPYVGTNKMVVRGGNAYG
jgi:hypothetical protein